jgi:hypothetical protein
LNPDDATDPLTRQVRRNRESRLSWDIYTDHRRRVTTLLTSAARTSADQICIVGAGNCNDVDLQLLRERFDHVHLVDLDGDALDEGLQRQSVADDTRIGRTAGVDLLTITPSRLLSRLRREMSSSSSMTSPEPLSGRRSGGFDVVASCGVLSQLVETVVGEANSDRSETTLRALQVRDRHVQLMADLLEPGGAGILVTDFVSSQTCPDLLTIDIAELPRAARGWIEQGNFFTGLNPWRIRQRMSEQSWPNIEPTDLLLLSPWRWSVGQKVFAVTAVCFRRRRRVENRER